MDNKFEKIQEKMQRSFHFLKPVTYISDCVHMNILDLTFFDEPSLKKQLDLFAISKDFWLFNWEVQTTYMDEYEHQLACKNERLARIGHIASEIEEFNEMLIDNNIEKAKEEFADIVLVAYGNLSAIYPNITLNLENDRQLYTPRLLIPDLSNPNLHLFELHEDVALIYNLCKKDKDYSLNLVALIKKLIEFTSRGQFNLFKDHYELWDVCVHKLHKNLTTRI